ncbi:acyloxyacyl hydrolase [Flagellimonas myxillae]|uniref:acyloxyacyl hydrolase n=1 Tax=Flagellimonas myxillae TaxID=2942214 RepID=UPI00201F792B|nr:acyloxyacyl hydrolase [Muricauda myxillae]MCL6265112.1 acyloxyacyl hydrolase [Muricauda myxillae]
MGTLTNFQKWTVAQVVFVLCLYSGYSQMNHEQDPFNQRLGLNYGQGTQQSFPFSSDSYTYDVSFIKINYNLNLTKVNKMRIGLNIEPGIYFSTQGEFPKIEASSKEVKAVSKTSETSTAEPAVMLQRDMNEYVLNLGLQMSYTLQKNLDWYVLGSVGPMIIDTETYRQKKGFAFSDILATGFLYRINSVMVDLRYGVRHVSNAGFGRPNAGYNSTNLEMGFSIPLRRSPKKFSS